MHLHNDTMQNNQSKDKQSKQMFGVDMNTVSIWLNILVLIILSS